MLQGQLQILFNSKLGNEWCFCDSDLVCSQHHIVQISGIFLETMWFHALPHITPVTLEGGFISHICVQSIPGPLFSSPTQLIAECLGMRLVHAILVDVHKQLTGWLNRHCQLVHGLQQIRGLATMHYTMTHSTALGLVTGSML